MSTGTGIKYEYVILPVLVYNTRAPSGGWGGILKEMNSKWLDHKAR
jgi:hypothetical protein